MTRCPPHDFDPQSGWCRRCTTRDDMRLLAPGGAIWRPGHDHDMTTDTSADA